MSEPITFVARVKAKAGAEDALRDALIGLVEATRKEDGCLLYVPHASLESPGEFVLYESWSNSATFEAHTKSPHFANLMTRMPELCAGPPSREMLRSLG